jgi:hypothetical protein
METTYEQIRPLIVSETWEGNQVKLKFKAPNQEQPIETIGIAMPDQEEMMKKIMAEVAKSTASSMAINSAASGLSNLAGMGNLGGVAGNMANQAGLGYQMDPTKFMEVELTDEVKQRAILTAFSGLQIYYELKDNSWSFKQPGV